MLKFLFSTACPFDLALMLLPLWVRIPIALVGMVVHVAWPISLWYHERFTDLDWWYSNHPNYDTGTWRDLLKLTTTQRKRTQIYWISVAALLYATYAAAILSLLLHPLAVCGHFIFFWNPKINPFSLNAASGSYFCLCDYNTFGSAFPNFRP